MTALDDPREYYADPHVQARIAEYCGASGDRSPTCAFVSELSPGRHVTWATASRYLTDELPHLLTHGDPDFAGDPLLNPAEAFEHLELAYRAVRDELTRLQLPLLDVMTGRGYHFAGRVPLSSPAVTYLAACAPPWTATADRAFTGLGMVLEYVAQNVSRRTVGGTPVVFNGVEIGRGPKRREAVSIDLSAYGDPMRERQMRLAFGTYQSHHLRSDVFGAEAAWSVPVLVAVPRRGRPLDWMLKHARTLEDGLALSRGEQALLPDVDDGIHHLIAEYAISPAHGPDAWRETYDRVLPQDMPPCVGGALQWPNDALLKPTVLQHLTRFLTAEGWAPQHIAGLVWSKYARDYGWGDRWIRLDPRRRAEFDVRVFTGAIRTGLDHAIDFNCVSSQEKGICPRSGCPHDSRTDRARLLERVAV